LDGQKPSYCNRGPKHLSPIKHFYNLMFNPAGKLE
jgi:hypothetical protein